ncbi:acyl-CoA synthetase [Natronorubrum sp. FCH18a]|uniref:acyl-CoA synthetase n=1 Tax=Natronorubrum sp. FCH18a TaxID=3447018 RepID=UPI003F5136E8
MESVKRLDAYNLHEQQWDSYEELDDAFEWELPETFNMAAYVCDRWASNPSTVALYYEDEEGDQATYTFRELQTAANELANHLFAQGFERGDRIAVAAPPVFENAVGHLAAWKLGAISIPLSTLFGPDALRYRLADSGAKGVIVHDSVIEPLRTVRGDCPDVSHVLTVDVEDPGAGEADFRDELAAASGSFDTVATEPDDGALLAYTSGTSGDPKGVLHGHQWLLGNLPADVPLFSNMEVRDSDVYWGVGGWGWIATLKSFLYPWFQGQPVVAYDGQFDAERVFELLERYDVSNVFIPPTALRMMMQVDAPDERYDVDSVRVLTSGGESLGQRVADWAERVFDGAVVHEGYGQTEMNPIIIECEALMESKKGTIGRPVPGRKVRIVDSETGDPVAPNTVGEIAVRCRGDPGCMKEYWNQPGATAETIRSGWLHTGDLGTYDEDGYVSFRGRMDDVIISSGYRLGPEEIEDAVGSHDAVADAGVVGVPDDVRGEIPKAFVTLNDDYAPSDVLAEGIQRHVKDQLAKYEYPREIEFVENLPRTTTGKIRREALRDRDSAGDDQ